MSTSTASAPGRATTSVRSVARRASPGDALVGIVGRVDPGKGIEVLIEAMAAPSGPVGDADLVVVGDVGVADADYVDGLRAAAAGRSAIG